jgi:hypothetical protein
MDASADPEIGWINQGNQLARDGEIACRHIEAAHSQETRSRMEARQVGRDHVGHLIGQKTERPPPVLHDDNDMHRRQRCRSGQAKIKDRDRLAVQHEGDTA